MQRAKRCAIVVFSAASLAYLIIPSATLGYPRTRRWEEVVPALKNMVEATKKLRDELKY